MPLDAGSIQVRVHSDGQAHHTADPDDATACRKLPLCDIKAHIDERGPGESYVVVVLDGRAVAQVPISGFAARWDVAGLPVLDFTVLGSLDATGGLPGPRDA